MSEAVVASAPSTSVRKNPGAKAISDFFGLQGLSPDLADSLAEASRIRIRERGHEIMRLLRPSVYFLVDGRVSEEVLPGKTRLWREVFLLGDLTDVLQYGEESTRWAVSRGNMMYGMCLSRCILIEVPKPKLASLATTEPAITLMLARMANKRHTLTERLYTVNRASPVVRVAAILNYLMEPTRRNVIRTRKDGALVMTTSEELVAAGPSQADIADALCLGRATVEKALSELRQLGALRAFGPGERTNRCYPVENQDLLRQIARQS